LESGADIGEQAAVLLCQRLPKQDGSPTGRREGVAGYLPLEWVAAYANRRGGKALPTIIASLLRGRLSFKCRYNDSA
jgi:hypothetical protein